MKTRTNRLLSLLAAALLFSALALPSVALALEPGQITVTIGATEITAQKAEADGTGEEPYTGTDGATIEPHEEGNGYTYNSNNQSTTDVSLEGDDEDLTIVQGAGEGSEENIIPNDVVTGADRSDFDETAINDNDIYLDEYKGGGGNYTTSPEAFPGATLNEDLVLDILDSHDITPEEGKEYLVQVGETTITGNKTVQEVTVTDADNNVVAGYEVTLEAVGNRTDKVFDSEGGVNITGKTNVVLAIDITGSMGWDLEGNNPSPGEETRWDILKKAATAFIDTVYGIERDPVTKMITNTAEDLNEHIGLSLVVYSGGDNDRVARTVELGGGGIVFTRDNVTDLLGYFASGSTRQSLAGTGTNNMLGKAGTNTQAGYMEVSKTVNTLLTTPSYGVQGASNIHVVFMTDGEANSYYSNPNNTTTSTAYNTGNITTASEKGADAAVELLKKGVSLHNIAINNTDAGISSYMNPDPPTGGTYFKDKLAAAGFVNNPNATYSLFNVNYTFANTPTAIIETYQKIAEQIVGDTLVATQARIIDVVPKGFDIYLEGGSQIRVVGKDEKGNTVIEWYIDELRSGNNGGIPQSTRYFLVPNSDLGGEFTFGTAYTNDSAILFAKPVARPGEEIAIVLDRPAVVISPTAKNDAVDENFNNSGFDFNLINGGSNGASAGSTYNLFKDSDTANKIVAVGTSVTDTKVTNVKDAKIDGTTATVTALEGGGWQFENEQLRVTVDENGNVTYTRLGAWPAGREDPINIVFDYEIGFGVDGNGIRQLIGEAKKAEAKANITLNAPTQPPGGGGDDDDDDPQIPLNPGQPDDDQFAGIPLGVPQTGGAAALATGLLLTTTAALAGALMHRRRKD